MASGKRFETITKNKLESCTYLGIPISVKQDTGGAGHGNDLELSLNGLIIHIELKTRKATEGGSRSLILSNGKLQFPNKEDCDLHQRMLGNQSLWEGRIPQFMTGNKSLDVWMAEKSRFIGIYVQVDQSAISDYYLHKGNSYILIEGNGLYHTGHDILNLGVPKFECDIKLRIRMKQHGKTPLPGSVNASFNLNHKTLTLSPYNFTTKLPPGFAEI